MLRERLLEIGKGLFVRKRPEAPARVSIAIPTLARDEQADRLLTLRRLLDEDLPRQTYPHYEAVVYCDGPNREVEIMARSLQDPRIRVFKTRRTLRRWGHPQTRLAIRKARGTFWVRMNDDNRPAPDYLETLVNGFDESTALVYARVLFKGDAAITYAPALNESGTIPRDPDGRLLHGNLDCMCYMVRTDWARKCVRNWNDAYSADWYFVEALLARGAKARFIDKIIGEKY